MLLARCNHVAKLQLQVHGQAPWSVWVGICVVTSEEKWDKLKEILNKWLARLQLSDTDLLQKELLSDSGFVVYVTRNYPPSYLI